MHTHVYITLVLNMGPFKCLFLQYHQLALLLWILLYLIKHYMNDRIKKFS